MIYGEVGNLPLHTLSYIMCTYYLIYLLQMNTTHIGYVESSVSLIIVTCITSGITRQQ